MLFPKPRTGGSCPHYHASLARALLPDHVRIAKDSKHESAGRTAQGWDDAKKDVMERPKGVDESTKAPGAPIREPRPGATKLWVKTAGWIQLVRRVR